MSIRFSCPSSAFRSSLLAICAVLALLGCERERVSVGTLPCSDDERERCAGPPREVVQPVLIRAGADSESERTATIAWEFELPNCTPSLCDSVSHDYLVRADGELTVASMRRHVDDVDLWVAWIDADGKVVFESNVPGVNAWLRGETSSLLTLQDDARGNVLVLVGRGQHTGPKEDRGGVLRGYAVARSGEVTLDFEVDTGEIHPTLVELVDTEVLVARPVAAPTIELASYARGGDLRWRQTQIASVPTREEIGVRFDERTRSRLNGLSVDSRGRIWGAVFEGVVGLVQLDPDGLVGWHGLVFAHLSDPRDPFGEFPMPIAIDHRDRPIIGVEQTVLRFEPDGSDAERRAPRASAGVQEQFWPQTVYALDVDEQDRIYVATQDGAASQHRLLIERISEDFQQRERFVLPLSDAQTAGHVLNGLQLAANGDAYVRIVENVNGLVDLGDVPSGAARIARVHVGE